MAFIRRLGRWALGYLEQGLLVQTVATLVSLPILISWGLGISYATVLGNLVGLPLLSLFLLSSSLLWCAALVGLRLPVIAWFLDRLTLFAQWLLAKGSPDWLVYALCPSLLTRFLGIGLLVVLFWYTRRWPTWWRIGIYALATLGTIGGLHLVRWSTAKPRAVELLTPKLALGVQTDGLVLDDFGFASRSKRPEQLIEYTLRSFLARRYGTVALACWTLHRVNKTSLAAATAVCTTCRVQRIRLPYFETLQDPAAWYAYFALVRACKERGTVLERFTQSLSHAKHQADAAVYAYRQELVVPLCTVAARGDICRASA